MGKQVAFTGKPALLREPIQCLPQKQCCPLTIVDFLRLPLRRSRNLRFRLQGSLIIQALKNHSAAAFQSTPTIVDVRGVMFQCAKEKRAKPSFLTVSTRVGACLNQVSEKALD